MRTGWELRSCRPAFFCPIRRPSFPHLRPAKAGWQPLVIKCWLQLRCWLEQWCRQLYSIWLHSNID